MASDETLHVLLQNKFDRVENLVQINHAATLAVPSVLATIWGVEGGLDNFRNAWILSIISIVLVLVWRYFAHYLDNDIASTYSQIIDLEFELDVPPHLSLFTNLIDTIKKRQMIGREQKKSIDDQCYDQKRNLIKDLIKKRRIGWRGHDKWDLFAICLTVVFFVIIWLNPHSFYHLSAFIFLILVISPLFLTIFGFFYFRIGIFILFFFDDAYYAIISFINRIMGDFFRSF